MERMKLILFYCLFIFVSLVFGDVQMQWVPYSPATTNPNFPAGRFLATSQMREDGSLMLYGGGTTTPGQNLYYGDLWLLKENTWNLLVASQLDDSGSCLEGNYYPPNLFGSISWVSGSEFWVFGGQTKSNSETTSQFFLDGLWKYSNGNWSYISGAHGCKPNPAELSTMPAARYGSSSWVFNNNIFLFGGRAHTSGFKSDIWMFNGQWTQVAGASFDTVNTTGNYVDQGIPSKSSYPGGRAFASTWTDNNGNLWVYGGLGIRGSLSDLWMFNTNTLQWTWISGDYNTFNAPSFRDRPSQVDSLNTPGGRQGAATWIDSKGRLWLFGGKSADNLFDDVWILDPSTAQWAFVSSANTKVPSARMDSNAWIDSNQVVWMFGGQTATSPTNDLWIMIFQGDLTVSQQPSSNPGGNKVALGVGLSIGLLLFIVISVFLFVQRKKIAQRFYNDERLPLTKDFYRL